MTGERPAGLEDMRRFWPNKTDAELRAAHDAIVAVGGKLTVTTTEEECTGIAASWCPICGTCICPDPVDDDHTRDEHPACPLHGLISQHAEPKPEESHDV